MKKVLLVCCCLLGIAAGSYAQHSSLVANTPAEKAKGLQKQLNLTSAQTTKIAAIYQESAQKFDKIKAAEHGNNDKMMADLRPLRQTTITRIKALLSPKQAVKYNKLVSESSSTTGNGWSDGWSSASAN